MAQQISDERAGDRTRYIDCEALFAGVVPSIVNTAVGVRFVIDKRSAPAPRAPCHGFYLDDAGAAIAEHLACPLIAAIRQFNDRQAIVDASHLLFLHPRRRRPDGARR